MPTTEPQTMLIVTGMSGAGRSTVGNALEDLGWYVVDNLPPQMLHPLMDLVERAGNSLPRIAAVVDIRGRGFFEELRDTVQSLRTGLDVRVIFLDATDAALVRRFESVRRPHPLQAGGSLLDGILTERARLAEIRESSDIVIDTSELNIHQLATRVAELFAAPSETNTQVTLMSFGFKYGLPSDADLIIDGRFLPNPFWVPELRTLNGHDEEVTRFVMTQPGARDFVDRFAASLEPVLEGYRRENKRHVLIGVGCTGGKHRSVALVRALQTEIEKLPHVNVATKDRDLGRE